MRMKEISVRINKNQLPFIVFNQIFLITYKQIFQTKILDKVKYILIKIFS